MEKMKQFSRRFRAPATPDAPDEGPSEPTYLAGHVLKEAIPAEPSPATVTDPEDLERMADPQRQSALLRLPIEVRRRIYEEVLEEAGRTQHVYVKDGRYTHTACITDHEAPDERQIEVGKIYDTNERFLRDPVWSRRLLSSWSNHWRCEESAVAATADGPPTPTPFLALLLSCKRMHLDCRQPLYEDLTFVLHRAETAINFLSIAAIAPEIRSLELSLQLDLSSSWDRRREEPTNLPWHSKIDEWLELLYILACLENLYHLSIWLDAASQLARSILIHQTAAHWFDERLVPFMRVSVPLSEDDNRTFYPEDISAPECVFGRGHAQFWQNPSAAPEITWSGNYRDARMYQTAEEFQGPGVVWQPRFVPVRRRIARAASRRIRRLVGRGQDTET